LSWRYRSPEARIARPTGSLRQGGADLNPKN
jgi:hypothetical protein